jgi:hypothetical protein
MGYTYKATGAGGNLGKLGSDQEAISQMEEKVKFSGLFRDDAKMVKRVK